MKYDFEELKEILLSGGVIVVPTETVYGFAVNSLNEDAVKKVYELKGRNFNNPMNVLVSNIDMIRNITSGLSAVEEKIIKCFMPGPLTIILKKNEVIPGIVTSGRDTLRS